MALSEHDQHIIDELERELSLQDPALVRRLRARRSGPRSVTTSIVGLLLGCSLLGAFCLSTVVAVGAMGFLVMAWSLDRLCLALADARRSVHDGSGERA